MVVQFATKARRYAYVFPRYKAAALASPFFFVEGSETSSKKRHILMHIRHWLLLHFFFSLMATKCLLKNATSWWVLSHFLGMASECSTSQKLSLRSFHRKYCTIKDRRPNLRFHCRQKLLVILHYSKRFKWMRSNQNTGKMYKII